ncbi:MAG: hypothetical protein U9R36_05360 [Elusimicrobiota bacterium]|nr:hypothetical protein [Elusimicrobiota bacterium]
MNKIIGFKIKIRKNEVLQNLKYTSNTVEIPDNIEKIITRQIENGYSLIEPAVVYETYKSTSPVYEDILNKVLYNSKQVAGILEANYGFTLMAATIGRELEKEVEKLKEDDLTSAFVLDAVGSEAAEQCANFVSGIIKREAGRQECYLSTRFSPGYGDWPLVASKIILSLLDTDKINIKISNSGILNPRKTITAIQSWLFE